MKKTNKTVGSENTTQEDSHDCVVVDAEPRFDSPQCEAKFRKALRGVPSKAFIKRVGVKSVLCLRPVNLLELGAAVNREGLKQCRATRKILQYLDRNKEEFLKFEHFPEN